MPSPFPGMDPFLEHPAIFPDFHDSFIPYLREHLQTRLPPPYFAALGQRVWIETSHRSIGPDVAVLGSQRNNPARGGGRAGATLAAPETAQAVVVRVPHDERREPFLEIYAGRREERRLVTVIEVLSPSNKTPGDHGRELYLRKQQELLDSRVHLVEIDLLRSGEHTTAVPLDYAVATTGRFDYHVSVRRWERLEEMVVYPIHMRQRLPEIVVPLAADADGISLDLQTVFDRCYHAGPYRREIDYAADPVVPPLPPDQAEWARTLLEADRTRRPAEEPPRPA